MIRSSACQRQADTFPALSGRHGERRSYTTLRDTIKRRIPIHPELVRLGFLEYVATMRNSGHQLLFPELRAANAATPMGDVFDDSWQRMRAAALPDVIRWFKNAGYRFDTVDHLEKKP